MRSGLGDAAITLPDGDKLHLTASFGLSAILRDMTVEELLALRRSGALPCQDRGAEPDRGVEAGNPPSKPWFAAFRVLPVPFRYFHPIAAGVFGAVERLVGAVEEFVYWCLLAKGA